MLGDVCRLFNSYCASSSHMGPKQNGQWRLNVYTIADRYGLSAPRLCGQHYKLANIFDFESS